MPGSPPPQPGSSADIVILGGGIAGPALAAAMADTGLRITLIERSDGPLDTVRGDHLQPVTCKSLESWGVLPHMWALGAEKRLGSRWFGLDGGEILHARVDNLDIPHPYYLYLNHELISRAFLERAGSNPNFSMMRPATGSLVRADGGYVVAVRFGNRSVTIRPGLVIAADGRNAGSRRALGITAETYNYVNPLVILFAPRPVADARNELHAHLTPQGIISVVPRTAGGWKIGFPVHRRDLSGWLQGDAPELARRLAELSPRLAGLTARMAGVYPVAMVNAERWFQGNVMLLGDACHALHPGRSQGMNIALRVVEQLSDVLHTAAGTAAIADPRRASALLGDLEARLKPVIDQRLEENHVWGLEMDRMEQEPVAAIERMLKTVAADPERRRRYAMNAAGY